MRCRRLKHTLLETEPWSLVAERGAGGCAGIDIDRPQVGISRLGRLGQRVDQASVCAQARGPLMPENHPALPCADHPPLVARQRPDDAANTESNGEPA
jgi:hypothetical protein